MTRIRIYRIGVAGIVLASALLLGATSAYASSSLFGGASFGGGYVTLVSDLSDNPVITSNDFSGISFDDQNGNMVSSLTSLGTDYNVTDDDCAGGSPRFQVRVDMDNDGLNTVADKNVFIYVGPHPSFTGCTPNTWVSTGNLLTSPDPRFDATQVGGAFYDTWANVLTLVGTKNILSISLVIDSGWAFADGEQTVLVDNVDVNGAVFAFTPRNINSSLFRISVTNRGSIDNETHATSDTGDSTGGGSIGGSGGSGGSISAGVGDENNGGALAGNGGSGGSANAGGLVETGDASADAETFNDLNSTGGELAFDCGCGDINSVTVDMIVDNNRVAPTQNNIGNLTQSRARTGDNTATGSTGGDAGVGGDIGAGAGDENNGGAAGGSGGAGGSGDLGGTVDTGSAWSTSFTINSVNFTRFRVH